MAYAFRSASTNGNAAGSAVTVDKPTNTADGDLIIVVAYLESDTNSWASVGSGFTSAGTFVNTGSFLMQVWWKIAASEGASWTWTPTSTSVWRTVHAASFSGAAGSGAGRVDIFGAGSQADAATNTQQTASSITPTVTGDLGIYAYANWGGEVATGLVGAMTGLRANIGGVVIGSNEALTTSATGTTYPTGPGTQIYAANHVALFLSVGGTDATASAGVAATTTTAYAASATGTGPPTFVNAGAAAFSATNGATITPALPTGWAAGDIHILLFHTSDNTDMATPAGWTEITPSAVSQNNTTAQRVEIYWRRAVAGDTAPGLVQSGTTVRGAQIYGVRGCITTGDPFSNSSRLNNAASATVSTTSETPADSNTFSLFLYAYEDDPSAATQPTNWSTFTVSTSALGSDMSLGWATRTLTTAAALNPSTTVSGGTFANSVNVGILLSLKAPPESADATASAGVAALTTTANAAVATPSVVASAGVVALTTTAYAATATGGAASTTGVASPTTTAYAATAGGGALAAAGLVALTTTAYAATATNAETASAGVVALTTTAYAATATGTRDATASAGVATSTAVAYAATATAGTNATANAGVAAVSTTAYAATATGGASASAGVATVTTSAYAPTAGGGATGTAGVVTLTTTAYAATGTGGATTTTGVATSTATAYAAVATTGGDATAQPGLATSTATAYAAVATGTISATANAGVATTTTTAYAASATNAETAIAGLATLTLTAYAPTTTGTATTTAGLATVTTTAYAASATGGTGATATAGYAALTTTAYAATGAGGATGTAGVASLTTTAYGAIATGSGVGLANAGVAVATAVAHAPTALARYGPLSGALGTDRHSTISAPRVAVLSGGRKATIA